MAKLVRIPDMDDVSKAEQFIQFIRLMRKFSNLLSHQNAMNAAVVKAMLREHDRRSGRRRAHKISRPIGLIAGIYVGIARLWAIVATRFEIEYAQEIEFYKTRRTNTKRTMEF